jgi:hypothetical protein
MIEVTLFGPLLAPPWDQEPQTWGPTGDDRLRVPVGAVVPSGPHSGGQCGRNGFGISGLEFLFGKT